MHDGSMSLIARNGVERKALIQRLLGTQGGEFLVDTHLRLTASLNGRFQPPQEPHEGHSVANHGLPKATLFGIVLDSLHHRHRRRLPDNLVGLNGLHQGVAYLVGVGQYVVVGIVSKSFSDSGIRSRGNAAGCKMLTCLSSKLFLVYEKRCRLRADEQIADEDGIAMNVATTKIERPGYIVQRSHKHAVSMLLAQSLSNAGKF